MRQQGLVAIESLNQFERLSLLGLPLLTPLNLSHRKRPNVVVASPSLLHLPRVCVCVRLCLCVRERGYADSLPLARKRTRARTLSLGVAEAWLLRQ